MLKVITKTPILFLAGTFFMILAVSFETITVAGSDYRLALVLGITFTIIADVVLMQSFRKGGVAIRIMSVAMVLPTLFVIYDFIRRAPFVFFGK